jgi:hypothetical protein
MRVACRWRAEERLHELALLKDTLGHIGSEGCLWNNVFAWFSRVFVAKVRKRFTTNQHALEFAAGVQFVRQVVHAINRVRR